MPSASKSRTLWQRFALAVTLSLSCAVAQADTVSFGGSVTNCGNTALIGSGPNMPEPSCDSDQDNANNIAVYTFSVPFGGFTDFTFGGFSDIDFTPFFLNAPALGPFQPFLTIFSGTGDSAVYVTASNPNPVILAANPADLHVYLTAGVYSLAISNLTNQSMAQLLQGGTLGQGFAGTGNPVYTGSGQYQLTATPIPEPDGAWLAGIGIAALLLRRRRRRGAPASTGSAA